MSENTHSPLTDRTTLPAAREALHELVSAHEQTETVSVEAADGRVVGERIAAARNVPHYRRAAMDGYAIRAADTFGASDRSPQVLVRTDGRVARGEARRVHTGSELPDGADAVVMIEHVEEVGEELELFEAVGEGENVATVGEDIEAGQPLYKPGDRLRPSDLGLLKSAGNEHVTVYDEPEVAVIPTGEELVQDDPEPGETVETNGLTASTLAERWGASAQYSAVVSDDEAKLTAAIEAHLDADIIVTTGSSSVGERDLLPDVVSELGELRVHGIAINPGHPAGLGVVEGTPVVLLPGYPVSCLVTAIQLLRPALAWLTGSDPSPFPTVTARLEEKVYSEPGIRSFARVELAEGDGERVATDVRTSGAGVLSSVALSDGWVVVPEQSEGLAAGETVSVQRWEDVP